MDWKPRHRDTLTGRGALGAFIVGVHVVLIALVGRAHQAPFFVADVQPLSITLSQPQPLEHPAATLPAPHLSAPTIVPVAPDVVVDVPAAPSASTVAPAAITSATVTTEPAPGPAPAEITDVAYLRQPQPHYPPQSRQAHEEGLVVVRVLIDTEGHAQQVSIVRSSGHAKLDAAACEAVMHALFKPHLAGGIPREALATVPVEFSLHRA